MGKKCSKLMVPSKFVFKSLDAGLCRWALMSRGAQRYYSRRCDIIAAVEALRKNESWCKRERERGALRGGVRSWFLNWEEVWEVWSVEEQQSDIRTGRRRFINISTATKIESFASHVISTLLPYLCSATVSSTHFSLIFVALLSPVLCTSRCVKAL